MYSDTAYGPFGEPYAQSGSTDVSFTGMNQDTVSNLYDFPAREYGTQGRWPSPDPAGSSSASVNDPQTWNRYAYVTNNPMSYVDATGMVRTPPGMVPGDGGGGWSGDFGACVWDDGSNDDPDDPDTGTAAGCAAQGGTFDSQLGDSDYNPDPDQDLADFVTAVQNSQVVIVNGQDSGNRASWVGCVAKTVASDAFWGAVGNAVLGVVGSTVIMGAAGTEVGPEGTIAGTGLGFSIGVAIAPALAAEGATTGALVGAVHGVIGCSLPGGEGD